MLLLFIVVFSEEEREQLRKFTNKSYLLDKRSRHHVYLGLIDILLAYCYEICVNEGDKNVRKKKKKKFTGLGTYCWTLYCHLGVLPFTVNLLPSIKKYIMKLK